jgi:hypothetical protein
MLAARPARPERLGLRMAGRADARLPAVSWLSGFGTQLRGVLAAFPPAR